MGKKLSLIIQSCLVASCATAHPIDYIIDKKTSDVIFEEYVREGFMHIIPLGMDHILFIVCVFFRNTSIKSIILQASLFTLAHSITLLLAMKNIIAAPPQIIEPLIAISILVLALENILGKPRPMYQSLLIFAFGLLHGMGFASALASLDFPTYDFVTALVGFNIGVELGQICIIVALILSIQLWFVNKSYYRAYILVPSNIIIGLIATYWTIERLIN
jgi:hypothetical protein